jgi:hypothetical protein
MYVIRDIMECKPGKVRDMVKKFKSVNALLSKMGMKPFRILTDVSGEPFWSVVAEIEAETVDAFFAMMEKTSTSDEARQIMSGYHDLVQKGRREIYKVET